MSVLSETSFEVIHENQYLVVLSHEEGSLIVNIANGETRLIRQRLPMGYVCHALNLENRNVETQFVYDILCDSFTPQAIQVFERKSFAIYVDNGKIVRTRFGEYRNVSLSVPQLNLSIRRVLQEHDEAITLKEYISDKDVGENFKCWITPQMSDREGASEWLVLPTNIPRKPVRLYPEIYTEMETMFASVNNVNIGVVVAAGKIAVLHHLINCSMKFELGSTRLCMYRKLAVAGNYIAVLVKSKPVKLRKKCIETFVTPNGSVLIKTIIKTPVVGKWSLKSASVEARCFYPGIKPTAIPPLFNCSKHPFFGDILFSNKMIWSSSTLKVLIGGTINSNCIMPCTSENNAIYLSYYILGFHDSQKYWRVPDVPDEMADFKNFLIKNGVPMWGDPYKYKIGTPSPSNMLRPLPFLREGCIEGRFLSNQFLKNAERPSNCTKKEEKDDYYVTHSCFQTSRNGKKI